MLGVHVVASRWKAVVGVPGAPGKPEMVAMASPVLVTVTISLSVLIVPAATGFGNTIGLGLKIRTGPLPPVPTKGKVKTCPPQGESHIDRKSTRLNSSHLVI